MALVTTYNGLVQSLIDASEDNSTEFSDYIPTAIDLAETRLIKEIFKEGVSFDSTIAVNQGDNKITKPTGYRAARELAFSLNGNTNVVLLRRRPRNFIQEYHPDAAVEGTPKYYGDFDGDTFIVAPTPSGDLNYKLHYIARPQALTVSNQTNFFTAICSDALFYSSMVEMTRFMKATDEQAVWETAYKGAASGLLNEAKRERGDDDNQHTAVDTSVNQ